MDAILMDISKLEGESQIKGYEKKIELLSYSHGVAMQITGDTTNTVRTSGKPNVQDFTVAKYLDKASPMLNQKCCEGVSLGQVKITVGRNVSGVVAPLIVYTLEDAIVSSVSIGGGGSDKPTETVTLNFTKIKWDYKEQKENATLGGAVPGVWDISMNQAK